MSVSISLADVEEFKLKEYTLEHMQAFGMYNHLHLDPWYDDSVLFVDSKGRVLSFTVILVSNSIIPPQDMWLWLIKDSFSNGNLLVLVVNFYLLLLFVTNHELFVMQSLLG